jgi:hypothetical protein
MMRKTWKSKLEDLLSRPYGRIAYGTVVTLDGDNDPNPEFLFIAGSTLATAAHTNFILKNGAKEKNVLWALSTAATLGARSVVEGSILADYGTEGVLDYLLDVSGRPMYSSG